MTGDRRLPRIVACLPAHNASAFVEETLHALAAQTYPNLRVLVSVDRSDDDTADRCERFAGTDARFSVIRQATRLGWIGNANALLDRAGSEADLLFFAPHDDLPEPAYVARLAEALRGNPRASLAFSDLEVIQPDGEARIVRYGELDGIACRVERGRRLLARRFGWWTPFRGLLSVETARRVGGLRRNLAGEFAADWPFVLHLALLGEFVRVPEVLYRKRYRTESLSKRWRYRSDQWTAAALSCGRTIVGADLTAGERVALLATLARRHADFLADRTLGRLGYRPRESA